MAITRTRFFSHTTFNSARAATGVLLILTAPLAAQPDRLTDEELRTIAQAEKVSDAFQIVARNVRPSVGRIVGYGARSTRTTGSGFVIDTRGHMLTNNHVVEDAVSLIVEFSDGSSRRADLVGTDPLTDLAVIRVDGHDLTPLEFAPDERLRVGQWVVAVGFPLGLDQTVTTGVISATNRHLDIVGSTERRGYEDFIQTDAAINRGNSGGPLLNLRGQVVGVNAVIVTQTGGSDGLGFAIPTSLAQYVTDQLIQTGRVTRAWLGVGIQDLTAPLARSYGLPGNEPGVLLTMVSDDDPAGRAGLRAEDIITHIDDQPIEDVDHLRWMVARMSPGATAHVQVYRDGKVREVPVVLAKMSDEPVNPDNTNRITRNISTGGRIGLDLEDLSAREAAAINETNPVFVAALFPGSIAQLAGLSDGDLIVEVDGKPLGLTSTFPGRGSAAQWLKDKIDAAPSGSVMRFTVRKARITGRGRIVNFDVTRSFVAVEMP